MDETHLNPSPALSLWCKITVHMFKFKSIKGDKGDVIRYTKQPLGCLTMRSWVLPLADVDYTGVVETKAYKGTGR